MIGKSNILDLQGAIGAYGTKKFIDNSFRLFYIGFCMLVIGFLVAIYTKNVVLIYCALWIGVSGLVSMLSSIIRLVKNIFYL